MHCTAYSQPASARPAEPVYGRGEELFNAVSHIVGGGLGAAFGIVLFVVASLSPSVDKYVSAGVYTFSVIALYTMSALYHFLPQGRAKRVFRVFDHCTIFLLIAGCYTPFCLIALRGTAWGCVILAVEWGLAVPGIALNAVFMRRKAVKALSMAAYVVMGWMIIPAVPALLAAVSPACFACLLAGGLAYTVGIAFFALGKRRAYMHAVWHLFVLAGTSCQFVSVLLLML